jgi:superfamily II DNA or RNA helicase
MPVTLQINPTNIKVIGSDPTVEAKLLDAFTWEDPKAKYMMKRHRMKHPDPARFKWCHLCRTEGRVTLYRNHYLPIGFRPRLEGLLQEWGVSYQVNDCRTAKTERQYQWSHDFDLRPYQQDIIDRMLAQGSGVIESPTGSGKTVLAAVAVCELGLPTVLVVPTKVIFQQFMETFQKHTDIPIGQIASGKYEEAPVQICICKSLLDADNMPHTALMDKQVLICDEVHQSASKQWEAVVNACPAYHRFGFSATPFRATDLECAILNGIAGNIIATVTTTDLQDEGYLCQTDIKMIPVAVSYDRSIYDETIPEGQKEPIGWRETTFAERYRQGIVENLFRNDMIAELVQHHYQAGDKVLVIISWTDHAAELLPMLPKDTIFLSGKDTAKKTKDKVTEYKERQGGVLLGSPVVDVGLDVPACDVVVMAGGGSYEGRQRQRLGRGLRPSPGKDYVTIYDFQDDDRDTGGRPMFWQHSKARVKAYKEVGQAVSTVESVAAALSKELTLGV